LPQGDEFARDVEHFRPKQQGSPLTTRQVEKIEKLSGVKYLQDTSDGSYPWLEFDYRNYRIVSAITNRGGAKHIYFPIALNTQRLSIGQNPWSQKEYSYFLDPTDRHDASLLFVKPNGEIEPIATKVLLTQDDFDNLPNSWHNDGFNYLRSWVTIVLFRLNDPVFIRARKEVYDKIIRQLDTLVLCIDSSCISEIKERVIEDIFDASLPSAPFSLAAKSALNAYVPPPNSGNYLIRGIMDKITAMILTKIEQRISGLQIDWSKP
jgi:hypothetical protein